MKKQKLALGFMAITGILNAQTWGGSSTTSGDTYRSGNVGIGSVFSPITSPVLQLDVRGSATFGSGLLQTDFQIGPFPNERSLFVTGVNGSNGFGSIMLGSNNTEATGQNLGMLHFCQKVSGKNNQNAGAKASIIGISGGTGGPNTGFGGNLIFCTTANDGAIIPERMRIDLNGNVGIGTTSPSEQLHSTGGVRFQGLTTGGTPTSMVVADATGKLWLSALPNSNGCSTANFVPVSNGSGATCSQIYDDGTSVGIGTTSGFSYTWVSGLTGNTPPPSSGTVKLYVNGVTKALAYFATSDARFKRDINPISNASNIISKLNAKTYFWKTNEYKDKGFNDVKQYGFIAQELEKVLPEAVAIDEKGYRSVNYMALIPILVQNAQEQQSKIDAQQKQLDKQSETINNLLNRTTGIDQLNNTAANFALDQNIPNPFSGETQINYVLPAETKNGSLVIYDLSGKQFLSFSLSRGASSITITSEKLPAGIYIYSIIADNKILSSKRMVITEK